MEKHDPVFNIIEDITNNTDRSYTYIVDEINKCTKADEICLSLPDNYLRKGMCEFYGITTKKNIDEAKHSFDQTINYTQIILETANIEVEQNNLQQRYNVIIMLSHRFNGRILFSKKQYQAALDEFNKAKNMDPVSMLYSLMIILYELIYYITPPDINEMIDTGIEIMESCASKGVATAYYFLGLMHIDNGLNRKALGTAKQYLIKAEEMGYDISKSTIDNMISAAQNNDYENEFTVAKKSWLIERGKQKAEQGKNNLNNNKPSSSKGCYVATCVYGSYDCPQVWTLRRFRDNILAKHFLGRLFIKTYYAVSPKTVSMFGKYKWFHKLFKTPLDKLVSKLLLKGIENTPYND